jgi:hypothetical protein
MFQSIYITFSMIRVFLGDPEMVSHSNFRKANGFTWPSSVEEMYRKEILYLCPSIAETDFPLVCPSNVVRCGPIVLDDSPPSVIADRDRELFEWLNGTPTVFVNLGLHDTMTERDVRLVFISTHSLTTHGSDLSGLLGGLLDGISQDTRVLWKLPKADHWASVLDAIFASHSEGASRRANFRIVSWVSIAPSVLLQHPSIKCAAHHGGANSFFEAC